MLKKIIPFFFFLAFASTSASAQNGGNSSAGGLPDLLARVEALEARVAELENNDIGGTQYVFNGQSTRYTDVTSAGAAFIPFENVIRLEYTSAIVTFDTDGTGIYKLTGCNSAGLYSDFDADNSSIFYNSYLCAPLNVEIPLTWVEDDNLVIVHIGTSVFDFVISDDGTVMSSTSLDHTPTADGFYDSSLLTGVTGVRIHRS